MHWNIRNISGRKRLSIFSCPFPDVSYSVVRSEPYERSAGVVGELGGSDSTVCVHPGGVASVCNDEVVVGEGGVEVLESLFHRFVIVVVGEVVVNGNAIAKLVLPSVVTAPETITTTSVGASSYK